MGGASRLIMLLTTPFPSLLPRHRPNAALLCLARHSHLSSSSLAPLAAPAQRLTLSPTSRRRLGSLVKASDQLHTQTNTIREDREFSVNSPAAHPWPEWSNLIDSLSSGGYFDNQREGRVIRAEDEFVAYEDLSDEFVRVSSACLAFARDRPELLGLLSRSDIGVIVENGTAFLFKSALDTARRMRAFMGVGSTNALESDKALTVDLMKYLLSYASKPIAPSERSNIRRGELIDSAVRNLLSEFARLGCGVTAPEPSASFQHQLPDRYGQNEQTPRPLGHNIEMKRGDWLCPRCNFMNFARNSKCLECEEARPKRQLTGGEWECPQCDFFNYGRNLVCLRCDCKRPGQPLVGTTNSSSVSGYGYVAYSNKPDIESRLAANDEKAQRWFSKVSQLDSASDFNSAATDEDFPDIMPLRKGVNRFVVSTRKTPLERRLANSQYERSMGSDNKTPNSRTLDEILGRTSGVSDNISAKNPQTMEDSEKLMTESADSVSLKASGQTSTESETWFKKVAELHGATDLANANSDEDFPDIMPMRKGENRFVVSKKKDRSLTSPIYKRRIAMEQAGTNFAPFVPFPPDYFAKKDKQNPDGDDSIVKATNGISSGSMTPEKSDSNRHSISDINHVPRIENQQTSTGNLNLEISGGNKTERKPGISYGSPISGNPTQSYFGSQSNKHDGGWSTGIHGKENRFQSTNLAGSSNVETSREKLERKSGIYDGSPISGNPTQNSLGSQKQNQNFEHSGKESGIESTNLMGNSTKQPENQNLRSGWTGKSLEGSAVQEPDPLDMSEEAKAQRWFRRVAQIKDISELSNIPDEDFPSIMPLRKGVNRFVVSKRKTPLERRLTSPQYRRNLPVVSSDPEKKENENS